MSPNTPNSDVGVLLSLHRARIIALFHGLTVPPPSPPLVFLSFLWQSFRLLVISLVLLSLPPLISRRRERYLATYLTKRLPSAAPALDSSSKGVSMGIVIPSRLAPQRISSSVALLSRGILRVLVAGIVAVGVRIAGATEIC
ncbi:uncharacterized protein K452DRAFT_289902 [Aplosporella prunicola CBS 121167]|uniref:Uncharacterized protein n=1 Tax=Aplosporella prunicola CBS 121167 TaxID=1176127 RepID=A0A6A6B821_9PEZI|nr:uncharacterized protein K452DRAFT_289902 [Aplosporella prunicola CBS 121167]KAF2139354.1 hypothetical protein K452DRAFT_289902 [Aplosporella prunicola CBS 121167]